MAAGPPGLGFGSWSSFGNASDVDAPATPPAPPAGGAPPSLESLRRQLDGPAPAPSVVGPPRSGSYVTLGERLGGGEGFHPSVGWGSSTASDTIFEPPERPSTAPVDDRARARDQQNVALLISSMQELTAVVATHSEEIRRLREDCRAFARREAINEALSDVALRAQSEGDHNRGALDRVERRLAQLEGPLTLAAERLGSPEGPLISAAERLSTREPYHLPPPPPGHYAPRGAEGGYPREAPGGHSPGHYPRAAEAGAPRFLTPADVPTFEPNGFRGV